MGMLANYICNTVKFTLAFQDPDNKHHVIRMHEHFYFRDHLCIVMELLSINLYELIKANQFAGFSTVLIRRFTTQILGSLVLMRHHRVVHCDLKPEARYLTLRSHSCSHGDIVECPFAPSR